MKMVNVFRDVIAHQDGCCRCLLRFVFRDVIAPESKWSPTLLSSSPWRHRHLAALSTVASSSSCGIVLATAQGLRSSRLGFRLLSFDRNKFSSLSVTGDFSRGCRDFENFEPQITVCYNVWHNLRNDLWPLLCSINTQLETDSWKNTCTLRWIFLLFAEPEILNWTPQLFSFYFPASSPIQN